MKKELKILAIALGVTGIIMIILGAKPELLKIQWYGDNPYDNFYCAIYNISPLRYEGGIQPPPTFIVTVDTNSPPDKTYVKFRWESDRGLHMAEVFLNGLSTIEGADVERMDNDTYRVSLDLSYYFSYSDFLSRQYYNWMVFVFKKQDSGGKAIWMPKSSWVWYRIPHTPETRPPFANAGGSYNTYVGQTLVLHGENSIAQNGYVICSYLWDISNDGTWDLSGKKPRVTFYEAGTYEVRLRVFDENGMYDDDIAYINVYEKPQNQPPHADAGGPYYANISETFVLNGLGSYDPDGTIVSYEWDINGDGIYELTGSQVETKFDFAGNYTIRLMVTDDDGAVDIDETYAVIQGGGETPPPTETTRKDNTIYIIATALAGIFSTLSYAIIRK